MSDGRRLNFEIVRPRGVEQEQFKYVQEKYERDLGYELLRAIGDGGVYSVKVDRESEPYTHAGLPGQVMGEVVRVSLWIGKVEVRQFKPYILRKLNFMQRLRVLFTGLVGPDAINIQ
jgi:hypothetical protein